MSFRYQDLQVWKESMQLVREIYNLTSRFPNEEKYGLVSQMRRASVSIPSNIAEGKMRSTGKDFSSFLIRALSSAAELDTQLRISTDLNFCDSKDILYISQRLLQIMKMLNSLIQKIR